MFVLLFVYVFGGAIQTPGFDYVDFLMPGHHRPVDRLRRLRHRARARRGPEEGPDRPLPLPADVALGGARRAHARPTSLPTPLARRDDRRRPALRLLLRPTRRRGRRRDRRSCCYFGYAFSWVFALVGLNSSSPETAQPDRLHGDLPAHLHLLGLRADRVDAGRAAAFANVNPFTTVVDALRPLWIGTPADSDVWIAFVWCDRDHGRLRAAVGRALQAGRREIASGTLRRCAFASSESWPRWR